MKTLVIHPKDPTTDFLSIIYSGTDYTIVNDITVSRSKLCDLIKAHDRIIMLGHGTGHGLGAMEDKYFFRYIIDSRMVYLLREKELIAIWCNADEFAKKYQLKGFITGMIISEVEEAIMYCVQASPAEILESNLLLPRIVSQVRDMSTSDIHKYTSKHFVNPDNPIIVFNNQNLHHF